MKKMQKLPLEHPEVCQHFIERKIVVETNHEHSNFVSPDMKLKQTTKRPKTSTSGIIGQTRKESFVIEWKSCFNHFTQTSQGFRDGELSYHELSGSLASEVQDAVHKVL